MKNCVEKKRQLQPLRSIYPDKDIVQSVLALREPANQDTEDVDNSTVLIIPTYQQFLAAVDIVQSYTQSLPGTEEILTLLNTMEKTCQRKERIL